MFLGRGGLPQKSSWGGAVCPDYFRNLLKPTELIIFPRSILIREKGCCWLEYNYEVRAKPEILIFFLPTPRVPNSALSDRFQFRSTKIVLFEDLCVPLNPYIYNIY